LSPFQVALMLKLKQNQKLVPTGNLEADANGPALGAGVPEGSMLLLNAPRDLSNMGLGW
jgi:hypothetical protein